MVIFVTILLIITAFGLDCGITRYYLLMKVKHLGCPFKQACVEYDRVETKLAVKRVLYLLIENNDLPKEEIHAILDSSIKVDKS